MVQLICAVKDIKSNTFNTPFFESNVINAVRGLFVVVNDPNSQLHHFPQDFELWQVGKFDQLTGTFENKLEFIQSALSAVQFNKEVKNAEKTTLDNGTNKNVK